MTRTLTTIREAAEYWVMQMNAIQQCIIQKLMAADPEDWNEVTFPTAGDRVYVYEEHNGEHDGEIRSYDEESDLFCIELDNGKLVSAERDDFEVEYDSYLPMWGTMWSFGDSCDDWWLEEGDGIRVMSECGFRIYEHEEFGYFFGIDGAGYSFFEQHWCPLYKARGLKWHDEEDD